MTPARKATLDRVREKAKEVRDHLKISNEKPQSVKPIVESPIPLEEFNTKININNDVPKKSYIKKGKHFYILNQNIRYNKNQYGNSLYTCRQPR